MAKINHKDEMLKVYKIKNKAKISVNIIFIQQYREILASPVRQKEIKDKRTEKEETKRSLFVKCHNCPYRKIKITKSLLIIQ